MKRIIAVLLAVFVSCGAALIGCTSKEPVLTQAAGNEGAAEVAVNENVTNPPASEPSEAPAGARGTEMITPEPDGYSAPDQPGAIDYMWLSYCGKMIIPYMSFAYAKDYVEHEDGSRGFLNADGVGFSHILPEVIGELPTVSVPFGTVLGENCAVDRINLYDPASFECTAYSVAPSELQTVLCGAGKDIVVEMVIRRSEHIEELDEDEYFAYSCAFIAAAQPPEQQTPDMSYCPRETAPSGTSVCAGTVVPGVSTPKPTAAPTPKPTPKPTAAPVIEPGENEFIMTGFLKVRAEGLLYTPVEKLDYSKLWLDDIGGFIHGDGLWFGGYLSDPEFAAALPRVPYDPDFGFVLAEGCSIYRIDVFDVDTHERIAWKISESELRQMAASAEDGLIAAVYVSCRGRCINGEYESWGNAYGFRLG